MERKPQPTRPRVALASGRPAAVRAARRAVQTQPAGRVSLLEADPDLAPFLPRDQLALARRFALCEQRSLDRGRWQVEGDPAVDCAHFGLFVVDGVLLRRAEVGRRSSVELLGAGDVLCPDLPHGDPNVSMPQGGSWTVLRPVRLAVLDEDFVAGLGGLRRVLSELNRRTLRRSRDLATRLALVDEPCLETRLENLLWHLADRFGRRQRGAVVLSDLPLTQQLLAELASAHRCAASRALARLEEHGRLEERPDGAYALVLPAS